MKHMLVAAFFLMSAAPATGADLPPADPRTESMQADAMKLCDRLAGTEREICVRQARENAQIAEQAGAGATPAVPGRGPAGQAPEPRSGNAERSR